MTSAKKVASAIGGRTARACDSCIRKRARWYCAADDAFLCQACDSSVHSANPLARRHDRVRLKTTLSYKPSGEEKLNWVTKKPRTPRNGKHHLSLTKHQTSKGHEHEPSKNPSFHDLVPEVGNSDETANSNHEENYEEQLLYRVPIFDPFVAELCCSNPSSVTSSVEAVVAVAENRGSKGISESKVSNSLDYNNSNRGVEFLPSDVELAEFAADVDCLLGKGLENECIGMEELGWIDGNKEEECSVGSGKVKVEEEEMEMGGRELAFDGLSFVHESHGIRCGEELKEKVRNLDMGKNMKANTGEVKQKNDVVTKSKRKIWLQLDYEAVITAWAGQKPWTITGLKPDLDSDEYWPHYLGARGKELYHRYGELGGYRCHPVIADAGREARVSRYREKRRTRLFSKKIRYEVRKLNAEKRPRMKGRFVKRASFAPPPPTFSFAK